MAIASLAVRKGSATRTTNLSHSSNILVLVKSQFTRPKDLLQHDLAGGVDVGDDGGRVEAALGHLGHLEDLGALLARLIHERSDAGALGLAGAKNKMQSLSYWMAQHNRSSSKNSFNLLFIVTSS